MANDLETFAKAVEGKPNAYPMAIKNVWELAESVYEHLERPEEVRRCQLASVELTIAMKKHVHHQELKNPDAFKA